MICDECETVAHCSKHGCIPKQPAQPLPFGVGGGLVAIKTLLSRDPCGHANTAIQMIDAILAEQPAQQEPVGEVSGHDWSTGILYRDLEPGAPLYTSPQPAQPQQEPATKDVVIDNMGDPFTVKAYVTPQPAQRTWVGLTDEDIDQCLRASDGSMGRLLSAIEAKLSEENHENRN